MQENICRELAKQIVKLRTKKGLTQDALAEKAGISTKYLQNLESKKPKTASVKTLDRLAKGLGIPIWKLLKF